VPDKELTMRYRFPLLLIVLSWCVIGCDTTTQPQFRDATLVFARSNGEQVATCRLVDLQTHIPGDLDITVKTESVRFVENGRSIKIGWKFLERSAQTDIYEFDVVIGNSSPMNKRIQFASKPIDVAATANVVVRIEDRPASVGDQKSDE
jgi:hypothetical protein